MINKSPSLLVPSQVPEFIAADAPKFVEFLQAYYEFLGEYNYDIQKARDVDQTTTDLVSFLKTEFASKYPKAAVDDRKLIRIIRNLYKSKGTLSAVELLFQIFYNEAVTIQQPGQNILRASDGRWNQDYSITLRSQYGTIDFSKPVVFRVENSNGIFFIESYRHEVLSSEDTRFFYKSFRQIYFEPGQYVDIVDSEGTITYRGQLILSPSSLTIDIPGQDWKLGQVIIFQSIEDQVEIDGQYVTTRPTIARASQVGPNGELLSVDIIQYGTLHSEGQSLILSPYPSKPSGTSWELSYEVISVTEIGGQQIPQYAYTLSLNSFTDGIRETLYGLSNARGAESYFLEDYTNEFYNARVVLAYERDAVTTSSPNTIIDPDLTYSQWLASRATLVYNFDYVVKYLGSFGNDQGQLSNPNIRLQDNYFYQLFSYVIQTTQQISQYRNALNLIHPAGLKYFGELAKTAVVDFGPTDIDIIQSRSRIYATDTYNPVDARTFDVVKPVFENMTIYDDIVSFEVTKALADIVPVTDDIYSFGVGKSLIDTLFASEESVTFEAVKLIADEPTTDDYTIDFYAGKALADEPIAVETITKDAMSARLDNADASDGSASINTETTGYAAGDYSSEYYASTNTALTIG